MRNGIKAGIAIRTSKPPASGPIRSVKARLTSMSSGSFRMIYTQIVIRQLPRQRNTSASATKALTGVPGTEERPMGCILPILTMIAAKRTREPSLPDMKGGN